MKECFLKRVLLVSFFAFIFMGCDPKADEPYLRPGRANLTFLGSDSEPQLLEVSASSEWTAEPSADWIILSDKTVASVRVSVADNDTDAERSARILLKSGNVSKEVTVIQSVSGKGDARFEKLEEFPKMAVISPNGKYIGGVKLDVDEADAFVYTPVVINVETNETVEFGPYPAALLTVMEVKAISDTGLLFVEDADGGTVLDVATRDFVQLDVSTGFDFRPYVSRASSDGSVWVGYNIQDGIYKPLKWVNDVLSTLPMPEKNYRGEDFQVGIMARGCSADGSLIYGTSWDNRDFGMLYWDKTGTCHWVGEDVRKVTQVQMKDWQGEYVPYNLVDGMTSESSGTQISYGGKYIAGTFRTEKLAADEENVENTFSAAFYNTETGKTKIFTAYGESVGLCATDDGIGFIGLGWLGVSSGVVVNIETGAELGTTQQWVKDNYGIVVPVGYVEYMCGGGETFMGVSAQTHAGGTSFVSWYVAPPLKN